MVCSIPMLDANSQRATCEPVLSPPSVAMQALTDRSAAPNLKGMRQSVCSSELSSIKQSYTHRFRCVGARVVQNSPRSSTPTGIGSGDASQVGPYECRDSR